MTTEYTIHIRTMVAEEDLKPWVVVQVEAERSGKNYLVTALKLAPNEAREEGLAFIEAAEAAEASANLVLSMREQKVPEETLVAVANRMKERRGRS